MSGQSSETGKIITSIRFLKKKKAFEVAFGLDKIVVSSDVYAEFLLYEGKTLSLSDYRKIVENTKMESLYQYALSLASRYRYSTYEVKKKLQAKSPESDCSYKIIARLKKVGMLDDVSYANEYKEEKEKQLYGKNRIIDELLHLRMVDPKIVASLSFQDEKENAKRYAKLSEKKYDRLPLKSKKSKAFLSLVRRGFEKEDALEAISSYKENKKEAIKSFEKDYEAAYRRLSLRYVGYDLKEHLFFLLRRKGYSSELINSKMEERTWKQSKN